MCEVDASVLSNQDIAKKHAHWFGSLQLEVRWLENLVTYVQPSWQLSLFYLNGRATPATRKCEFASRGGYSIVLVKKRQSHNGGSLLIFQTSNHAHRQSHALHDSGAALCCTSWDVHNTVCLFSFEGEEEARYKLRC